MDKESISIPGAQIAIPAVLWGNPSEKLLIGVHGNLSHKEDTVIAMMAQKAVDKGYCALSFDLPMHGARAGEGYTCTPENCVRDLQAVYAYAGGIADEISLFACSMGAYFSLLGLHALDLRQSLFLSPVVNMERIIHNMMAYFQVSEERLKSEKIIPLPDGQALDWDYYCYVRSHPVDFGWNALTAILYGSDDNLSGWEEISAFAKRYRADVQILEHGEHYFHTESQLQVFDVWAEEKLL